MFLFKKAEGYDDEGSKDVGNYLSTSDGTEVSQNYLNTYSPSNGDGQGAVYDKSQANHATTPQGEQGHYSDNPDAATPSSQNQKPTNNEVAEMPYPQSAVDDNHADGGYFSWANKNNKGFLNLFKASGELGQESDPDDFFTNRDTSGVANSPQVLHDGFPPEEFSSVRPVINNYISQTDESASLLKDDPGVVDEKLRDNSPEINKGRRANQQYFFTHISLNKKADIRENDESNVDSIMNPDEEKNKHEQATHDYFDEGRTLKDQTTMVDNPLNQGLGLEEENMYSGTDHSASLGFLNLFRKKADVGLMPSTNPNSGKDSEYPDSAGENTTMDRPTVMSDGKNAADSCNEADKADYDVSRARRKIVYKDKTEDTDNYFSNANTGGGFGGGGDGQNFSGVDHT